jgi:cellulose synthase/poly-beta-1,6-N-acetylglucosamine synthase-like glycosyltransferase
MHNSAGAQGEGTLSAGQPTREPGKLAVSGPLGSYVAPEQACQQRETATLHPQRGISFNLPYFKLSILMPAYNEEGTIARAIDGILEADYPCDFELIVVDDGSTDGTRIVLSRINDSRLIVHRHLVNQGKGAALLSAVSLATGTHALPFDADLEYLPEDIPRVLEPVMRGRCSFVYGTR